jgi:hypothetical protein
MNKLILTLIICFSSISINNCDNKTEFSIVGKWEWDAYSSSGSFIFRENGEVVIESEGEVLGGNEFVRKDREINLEYKVNYDKTPMTLDLIFTDLKTKNQLIKPGIMDIIDNNIIIIAIGSKGIRPTEISKFDDRIVLERIK